MPDLRWRVPATTDRPVLGRQRGTLDVNRGREEKMRRTEVHLAEKGPGSPTHVHACLRLPGHPQHGVATRCSFHGCLLCLCQAPAPREPHPAASRAAPTCTSAAELGDSRAALAAAPAGREDFDENQTGGVWGKYKEMNEGPQMGVPPETLSSPNIPPHDFRRPLHLARGPPISHWPSTAPTDDEADISQLPL